MTTTTKAQKPSGLIARLFPKNATPAVADVDEQIAQVERQRQAIAARRAQIEQALAEAYGDADGLAKLKTEHADLALESVAADGALAQLQHARAEANVRALLERHLANVRGYAGRVEALAERETPEKLEMERLAQENRAARDRERRAIIAARIELVDAQNRIAQALNAEQRAAFVAGAAEIAAQYAQYLDKNFVSLAAFESGWLEDR